MRAARFVAAAAMSALSLIVQPRVVHAQGKIRILLPRDVPFPAAPIIVVNASNFPDSSSRRKIRLRLGLDFGMGLVLYDSTKAGDDKPSFSMIKLLPENRDIYVEASVLDASGNSMGGTVTQFAGHTGPRLEIVSPTGASGVVLSTRRPTFRWRSAKVSAPPGPWVYELSITETATQVTRSTPGITDTVFTYPVDLDASTSYRWKLVARLPAGLAVDSVVALGSSTFTIQASDAVVKTLLYQNFPNPFPAASSQTTCFWFDLKNRAHVELTVHDLRGHRVRTIIPGELSSELDPGRYGRASEVNGTGCDPRLRWDGTADDGRVVPAGVYLLRFTVDGVSETMKKVLFLGR